MKMRDAVAAADAGSNAGCCSRCRKCRHVLSVMVVTELAAVPGVCTRERGEGRCLYR